MRPTSFLTSSTRRYRAGIATVILLLVAGVGCRTQEDAVAAASQMATTSSTMVAYYKALDLVLSRTDDAYQAQAILLPEPDSARLDLADMHAQIKLRQDLAENIVTLSQLFQKLTGSTAAADSSTAAANLNSELVSLKAIASNDKETQALTFAVKAIVLLIQHHDEVKAARLLSPLCHQLSVFFDSERARYDSINQAYLLAAKSVAEALVNRNGLEAGWIFNSALQPFTLAAKGDAAEGHDLKPYLKGVIKARYDTALASGKKATQGLSDALHDMDARIAVVASDKPMHVRLPPFSLALVESWISTLNLK